MNNSSDKCLKDYDLIYYPYTVMPCIVLLVQRNKLPWSYAFIQLKKSCCLTVVVFSLYELQSNYPARVKALHMYNAGALLDLVMMIAKFCMPEKIQKRVR